MATVAGGGIADVTAQATWTSSNAGVATVDARGQVRAIAAGSTVITATFLAFHDSATVQVLEPGPYAPDPAQVAPVLAESELTSFSDATSFLYTGPTPVQSGVAAGTIEPRRATVARGVVRTHRGAPLGGVRVSVLDHPNTAAR